MSDAIVTTRSDPNQHLSATQVPTLPSESFRAGSDLNARTGAVPLNQVRGERFDAVPVGGLKLLDRPPNTYIAAGSGEVSVRVPVSNPSDPRSSAKFEGAARTAFGAGSEPIAIPPETAEAIVDMGRAGDQAGITARTLRPSTQNTTVTPALVGTKSDEGDGLTVRPGISITGNGLVAFATLTQEPGGGDATVRFEVLGGGSIAGEFDGETLRVAGREIRLPEPARAQLAAMLGVIDERGAPSELGADEIGTQADFDALINGGIRV